MSGGGGYDRWEKFPRIGFLEREDWLSNYLGKEGGARGYDIRNAKTAIWSLDKVLVRAGVVGGVWKVARRG